VAKHGQSPYLQKMFRNNQEGCWCKVAKKKIGTSLQISRAFPSLRMFNISD